MQRRVTNLSPSWVHTVWSAYIDHLGSARDADVVVVGNTGSIADVTMPEAFLAHAVSSNRVVTIVLDVASTLLPHPLFYFHSSIAPSQYAQQEFRRVLTANSRGVLQ